MPTTSPLTGNELSSGTQGQALILILSELRVIAQIMHMQASGRSVDDTLELMRAETFLDSAVRFNLTPPQ